VALGGGGGGGGYYGKFVSCYIAALLK
jgi:hypothetical protein